MLPYQISCVYQLVNNIVYISRSASNPMDKGACNSIYYQYYGQNSKMEFSVWFHHPYVQQGCTEWTTILSCCMTKVRLALRERLLNCRINL